MNNLKIGSKSGWPTTLFFMFVFFPVGLYLLWRLPGVSRRVKAFTSVVLTVCLIWGTVLTDKSPAVQNAEPTESATSSLETSGIKIQQMPQWSRPRISHEDWITPDLAFIATVIDYGDPYHTHWDQIRYINIEWKAKLEDGKQETFSTAITLAMVTPVDLTDCGAVMSTGNFETPEQALHRLLPLGSRVLVIPLLDNYNDDHFLHLLEPGKNVPLRVPPSGSLNEQLVQTGTWRPDHYSVDLPFEADSIWVGEGGVVDPFVKQFDLTSRTFDTGDFASLYWAQIINSANNALVSTDTGSACFDAFRAAMKVKIKDRKIYDREVRETELWYAELKRNSGGCRDGDGDGWCGE